jgi:hypothetical protein
MQTLHAVLAVASAALAGLVLALAVAGHLRAVHVAEKEASRG